MSDFPSSALKHPLAAELLRLPHAYAGATAAVQGPQAAIGVGEMGLHVRLAESLLPHSLGRGGVQWIFAEAGATLAQEYGLLAEAQENEVRRVFFQHKGEAPEGAFALVPSGVTAAYHVAQMLAHAAGASDQAKAADDLLAELAERFSRENAEENPALDLAWRIHGRQPILLEAEGEGGLAVAIWQNLLARVGKTISTPILGDAIATVGGMFEGRQEWRNNTMSLVLGERDAALEIAAEILALRTEEVVDVPHFGEGHAADLAMWYLAAWTSLYVAHIAEEFPADSEVYRRAKASLSAR